MTDADELIELLTRRHGILSLLVDESMERHELVDELDASKSTVYKGVSQLEASGLLESTADGLRPTPFGTEVHRRYEELARIMAFRDLLAVLPTDVELTSAALRGAELIAPESRAIDRPFVYVEELLREADSLRGFSPVISPNYVSLFHERLLDDGIEAELLFEADVIEGIGAVGSDRFGLNDDELADIATNDAVRLWRTDTTLPFGLLIARVSGEERMVIEIREAEVLRGLLVNRTTESVRWAKQTFRDNQQHATRVETLPDFR